MPRVTGWENGPRRQVVQPPFILKIGKWRPREQEGLALSPEGWWQNEDQNLCPPILLARTAPRHQTQSADIHAELTSSSSQSLESLAEGASAHPCRGWAVLELSLRADGSFLLVSPPRPPGAHCFLVPETAPSTGHCCTPLFAVVQPAPCSPGTLRDAEPHPPLIGVSP